MPLSIRDGNSALTTLSTVVTGGEHIPAHTVVSLGPTAISNIASAVSGSVVSISNFPSTQTVAGTVTANVFGLNSGGVQTAIPVQNGNEGNLAFSGIPIAWNDINAPDTRIAGTEYPLPIQGTVTANVPLSTDGYTNETGIRVIGVGYAGGLRVQGINPNTFAAENLEEGGAIPIMGYEANPLPISGTVTANGRSDIYDSANDVYWNKSVIAFGNPFTEEPTLIGPTNPLPISGTVTANAGNFGFDENQSLTVGGEKGILVGWYDDASGQYRRAGDATPLPISGTVTVGNSVTIGSLPAISGTVTVGNSVTVGSYPLNSKRALYVNSPGYAYFTGIYVAQNQKLEVNRVRYISTNSDASIDYRTDDNRWYLTTGGGTGVYKSTTTGSFEPIGLSWQQGEGANLPPYPTVTTFSEICVADAKISSLPAISGTVTARLQDSAGIGLTSTTIGSTSRLNVTLASAVATGSALPAVINVYGGSDSGVVRAVAVDSSGRSVVTISNFPTTQPVSLTNTTVTISSFPRPTWTNYSGTIVTANSAITAVSTITRSYLLAQVTTGQLFLNIGATATTLNSVYFSAGQGFAWETAVPQGIVSIISPVTGTNYVLKDG